MSLLIHRVVFGISESAKNWTIVKNRFLVPAKPKRSQSSYILFSNEKRSTLQGSIGEIAKKLGAQWKTLPAEQKQKYQDEAKKLAEKHKIQLQQYQSKYVEPFKTINSSNLAVKYFYQQSTQKVTSMADGSKKLTSIIKNLTQQQKKKFAEEAQKIKAERAKIQSQFEIPQPQFKTRKNFIDHTLREKGSQTFSMLQVAEQEKINDEYTKYFENWNKTLQQFAKKHNLTLQQFTEIIKVNQRKLRKQELSDDFVNQLSGPEKPKKLKKRRTVAGKRITLRTAPRKTATRTKVTKKAKSGKVEKKTAAKSTKQRVGRKAAVKKTVTKKTAAKKA